MSLVSRWLMAILLPLGLLVAALPAPLRGDDAPLEPAVPLTLFTVASVDRAMSDIAWMFQSAQRSDMLDVIGGLLGQAGDLKGIDRSRPFGQAFFLQTDAFPPRPAIVFFAPVENLDDLLKTIARAPVTPRKSASRADVFELFSLDEGGGADPVASVRIIGNYAYAVPTEFESILDRLPDIQKQADALAARYDAAFTVQVKAVPLGVRQVFVNFLRTQAEIDLQRRDEEDEAAYLVRRANGMNGLELIEQVTLQGEDLTIGWNAEPEQQSGYFEGTLNASPDSEFAKYLTSVGGKSSMFTPLRDADRPLTVNISWVMNKREQTALSGLLQAARVALSRELPTLANAGGPIERLYDSLQATVDAGHFDAFQQFAAADVQEFVFVGGLKLAGAQAFGQALQEFLQGVILHIQTRVETDPNFAERAPQIVLNADSHQGIAWHKFIPKKVPPSEQRLYGGIPDLYVGTSSRAFWFAVGRNEALPILKSSVDRLLAAPPTDRTAGGNVPVSVTLRVAPWLELPIPEDPEGRPSPTPQGDRDTEQTARDRARAERRARNLERARDRRELAQEAFSPSDSIRMEGRTTESGFRVKVHLDGGFIKLLGLSIAREYDRSQL